MKLRTLCCNKTVLKKDITRFAPVWAIYLVGGLLVMLTALSGFEGTAAARDLCYTIGPFSSINMIYAAVCAQMLFGDLYRSRMCNALHTMPLRRESWFMIHTLCGILFSLVPHLVGAVCMGMQMGSSWYVAFIWLLGMSLEYLFFFGLAVFCVFCAGNRVGQLAVYSILNFGAVILYWFVNTIYEPLLYGVQISQEPFLRFCPVVQMSGTEDMVLFERILYAGKYDQDVCYRYLGFGTGWGYLTVCAVIGVALLGLGLLLYRRRKLETAGNFIAIRSLEPVFAVVFTLCAGAVFASVGELFEGSYLLYLVVGLVLGWFVGQMLLRRTVRVFQGKTFLKLGIFGLAMAATLALTALDPLGIVRWVPEPDRVLQAELNMGGAINTHSSRYRKLNTAQELALVQQTHSAIVREGEPEYEAGRSVQVYTLCYTLKNGRTVSRTYTVQSGTQAYDYLAQLYSAPESILGYTDWDAFLSKAEISIEGWELYDIWTDYRERTDSTLEYETLRRELLEAMKQDCEAGWLTMDEFCADGSDPLFSVTLECVGWRYVTVYGRAVNTRAWYETYGELLQPYLREG